MDLSKLPDTKANMNLNEMNLNQPGMEILRRQKIRARKGQTAGAVHEGYPGAAPDHAWLDGVRGGGCEKAKKGWPAGCHNHWLRAFRAGKPEEETAPGRNEEVNH